MPQNIYSVFDDFLDGPNWLGTHVNDDARFYMPLHNVITHPDFNPDKMGEYMRSKKGVRNDDDKHPFWLPIQKRVDQAWAVREYLKLNQL